MYPYTNPHPNTTHQHISYLRSTIMQKASLRKVKAAISHMPQENDDILHFSLQGLLPADHILALNTTIGTLSHLASSQDRPQMIMQQQFTSSEINLLMPLLEAYPYYCPYEVLLASFSMSKLTDANIARCKKRLEEAQEAGVWELEMRPVRNVLSRTRMKTRAFGIDILSILE